MPDRQENSASWRLVIEELAADLARVRSELALADGGPVAAARWSPPITLGPLPDEYARAVRDLIDEQRSVLVALEEARRRTGEHLAAVRAAEPARGYHAAYLDVEG